MFIPNLSSTENGRATRENIGIEDEYGLNPNLTMLKRLIEQLL